MIRICTGLCAFLALVLTACAPLSPAPQSSQAARIASAPGKAVIYIVRGRPDISDMPATLALDDRVIGSTHAGTYFRLEVAPGRHRLAGYASDNGAIALDVQADRVYFVQHTVAGNWREASAQSFFELIDEARARAAMAGSVEVGRV